MQDWRYWLVFAIWLVWEAYWAISARGVKRAASKELGALPRAGARDGALDRERSWMRSERPG